MMQQSLESEVATKTSIVFIEDDPLMQNMVTEVLRASNFECHGALEGHSGLRLVQDVRPDLLLLDLQLGSLPHGLDICDQIRADPELAHTPIIVLTGGTPGTALEIRMFEKGVDEFIEKQRFNPRVFIQRVHAVLRRARQTRSDVMEFGPLSIHLARREVLADGRPVNLTPTEFDILYKLAQNSDRALSRDDLLDRGDGNAASRTVDVHVLSIRRKLAKFSWLVSTVHGTGYRLGTHPGS